MAQRHLNLPAVQAVRYKRNFINTAVCELRFPTLLELEQSPPRKFQAKVRREYPFYEAQVLEQIAGPDVTREPRYLFRSKDKQWTLAIRSFSIALETTRYIDFEDFLVRFKKVLANAEDLIDADFFTRVGLRYINRIPIDDGEVAGWVRSELIQPLTTGTLGSVSQYAGVIHGYTDQGQYTVRHGMKDLNGVDQSIATESGSSTGRADKATKKDAPQSYLLDFDFFTDNVESGDVERLIKEFNKNNFALFFWCLGEKAKKALGEGVAKK